MSRQHATYLQAALLAAARRRQANNHGRRVAQVVGTTEATVDGRKVEAEVLAPVKTQHKPTDRKV